MIFFTVFVEAALVVEALGNCPVCPPLNPALIVLTGHGGHAWYTMNTYTASDGQTEEHQRNTYGTMGFIET